jgi:cytidyltransferase-like protein
MEIGEVPVFTDPAECGRHLMHCHIEDDLAVVNGRFDPMHAGHASLIQEAFARHSAVLVLVNSDASIRKLGKTVRRPQEERICMLRRLPGVVGVGVFDEKDPCAFMKAMNEAWGVKAACLVKGMDYDKVLVPESEHVGRVMCLETAFNVRSSDL